jgi:hypothetical protein
VAIVGNKLDKKYNLKISNHELVKMRDCKLKSIYSGKIQNILLSVKSNEYLQEATRWSSEKILNDGLYKPIEYILSKITNKNIKVNNKYYEDLLLKN